MDFILLESLIKKKLQLQNLISGYEKILGLTEYQSWSYNSISEKINNLEQKIIEIDQKIKELL